MQGKWIFVLGIIALLVLASHVFLLMSANQKQSTARDLVNIQEQYQILSGMDAALMDALDSSNANLTKRLQFKRRLASPSRRENLIEVECSTKSISDQAIKIFCKATSPGFERGVFRQSYLKSSSLGLYHFPYQEVSSSGSLKSMIGKFSSRTPTIKNASSLGIHTQRRLLEAGFQKKAKELLEDVSSGYKLYQRGKKVETRLLEVLENQSPEIRRLPYAPVTNLVDRIKEVSAPYKTYSGSRKTSVTYQSLSWMLAHLISSLADRLEELHPTEVIQSLQEFKLFKDLKFEGSDFLQVSPGSLPVELAEFEDQLRAQDFYKAFRSKLLSKADSIQKMIYSDNVNFPNTEIHSQSLPAVKHAGSLLSPQDIPQAALALGGTIFSLDSNQVYSAYTPADQTWNTLQKVFKNPLVNFSAILLKDPLFEMEKMMIVGGYPYHRLVYFSEDGKNWENQETEAICLERQGFGLARFHPKGYPNEMAILTGGRSGDGKAAKLHNDVWQSMDGVEWKKLETGRFAPLHEHSLVAFGGELFSIGGCMDLEGSKCHNEIWSTKNGKGWTSRGKGSFSPRGAHSVVAHGDRLYLYGGYSAGKILSDLWMSEDGLSWKRLESLNLAPRAHHQIVSFRGNLWVIGGIQAKGTAAQSDFVISTRYLPSYPPFLNYLTQH